MKNSQDFLKYVASFNLEYATKQTARDLIKQAKKIKENE